MMWEWEFVLRDKRLILTITNMISLWLLFVHFENVIVCLISMFDCCELLKWNVWSQIVYLCVCYEFSGFFIVNVFFFFYEMSCFNMKLVYLWLLWSMRWNVGLIDIVNLQLLFSTLYNQKLLWHRVRKACLLDEQTLVDEWTSNSSFVESQRKEAH